MFMSFDKILQGRTNDSSQRNSSKKHSDFADKYIADITNQATRVNDKIVAVTDMWDGIITNLVQQSCIEIANNGDVNEEILMSLLNSPAPMYNS